MRPLVVKLVDFLAFGYAEGREFCLRVTPIGCAARLAVADSSGG